MTATKQPSKVVVEVTVVISCWSCHRILPITSLYHNKLLWSYLQSQLIQFLLHRHTKLKRSTRFHLSLSIQYEVYRTFCGHCMAEIQPTAADNWQATYELQQSDSASYNALNSIPPGSKSAK